MMIARRFTSLILVLTFIMMSLYPYGTIAQNAPVTTIASVGSVVPGQVTVPITVTGFNNIGAISLCFDYPYAGLHFSQGVPNPLLSSFAIGDQDLGNGKHRISMGWFGSGTSLANGSVIMSVTFTYLNGINTLEFFDNGPSCEYADASYNVLNDIPQSTYYINGTICGSIGIPGQITGITSVCQGQSGVIYSVAPVANATSYNWIVPPGATIVSGNNTNTITANFSPGAVSGSISVNGLNICGNGPSSQLAISLNPLPLANAGSDVTIPYGTSTTLHALSGGSGSYNYHWSPEALLVNPNIQNPQTINLTVTQVFNLLVTNQVTSCADSDKVVVSISGGPLNANPVAIPNMICRGTPSQLFANAGGGSGTYTYSWSCIPAGNPPWVSNQASPIVFPDSSTVYHLLLSDGFNTIQASTSLTVFQLPSATMYGGDTLCGSGNSTMLSVALTGNPPWSFYYSNGITTWYVPTQNTTPASLIATEPGIYTVLAVTDEHCTGSTSGSAIVAVFPVPPTPAISINGNELLSTGCCGNQWYKDGALIPGATSQIFQPQTTAHYFDIVTVNGCSSDTSNVIYYLVDDVDDHLRMKYYLEPVPAENYITVKSHNGNLALDEIKIYSSTGKPEIVFLCDPLKSDHALTIDIQRLSPGLYFMEIISESGRSVRKFVVL